MNLKSTRWTVVGSAILVFLLFGVWSQFRTPDTFSERTLSSKTTAFEFYLGGFFQESFQALLSSELEIRPLNDASIGSMERLILDLYTKASLNISGSEASEAFSKALGRSDFPSKHEQRWTIYEKELLRLSREQYSIDAFVDQIDFINRQRIKLRAEGKSALQEIERFRIYFAHGLKRWNENPVDINLRWLFAAGYAGSFYYAQGREQLENYLSRCQQLAEKKNVGTICRADEIFKAEVVLKMISGLDGPIGDETE